MDDGTEYAIRGIQSGLLMTPFGATAEEALAHLLDTHGLISAETTLNGTSGKLLSDRYYMKQKCFEANTRLGELLLQANVLTPHQLEQALACQKQTQEQLPLGEVIVELGLCTRNDIEDALLRQSTLRAPLDQWGSSKHEWQNRLNTILGEIYI